ncbi:MAG: N-acetylmuramoyl-L-alanine amidase, partial [Planctomycetota bacterium]
HADRSQGVPTSEYRSSSSDRTATVSLSPRYAEYMNRQSDGSLSDRVFISYHSNAGGGSARGILGLYNGNNSVSSATPNQFFLADTVAREVNNDLVAQNGQFEHTWFNRSTVTLDRSDIEFGEINNTYIQNEFDATIIETGFHDNQQDAEMLRDPKVRDAIGRATYQGVVKYFRSIDGTTPLTMAPSAVTGVRVESLAEGVAVISWDFAQSNSYAGDAADGYRVFVSSDGYGFDGGTEVAGNINSLVLANLDPNRVYYFQVAAFNEGGESPRSSVVAGVPGDQNQRVLIVDGFDRYDRSLNPRVRYGNLTVDRVRPRFSNSFDYAIQAADAIHASNDSVTVDTIPNQFVGSGTANLELYDAVIWLLGEESSQDSTFDADEQVRVENYLAGGGKLFVSGSEIAWDLDQLGNGRSFYKDTLRANYVADDANTYNVSGSDGSLFEGISLEFDDGSQFYDVNFPDVISASGGSTSVMQYEGGSGGTAAIAYDPGMAAGRVVVFGFPFETIVAADDRAATMFAILDFFELEPTPTGDFDDDGQLTCEDLSLLSQAIQSGQFDAQFDVNADGVLGADDILFWITEIKQTNVGDANLDFTVDISDFNLWNANKFTSGTTWCQGDFNGDGVTDISDFNLWNSNKFTTANTSPPAFQSIETTELVGERNPRNPTSTSLMARIFENE